MITWGVSANSHDAALAVFKDDSIVFASHAERFSRKKNDAHLNQSLIRHALEWGEPDRCVWYEKPITKTVRQLIAGQGWQWAENNPRKYLRQYAIDAPVRTVCHHHSHAAAGYFTSTFDDAVVVCIDAIGEVETLSVWQGRGRHLERIYSQGYPHSIGLWYSAMTQRVGLTPNEDEYILMGMAAYGDDKRLFNDILRDFFHPINQNSPRIEFKHNLHRGCSWWRSDLVTEQDLNDIAAATQSVYQYLLKIISNWARKNSAAGNLVFTGGCALNCAANSVIASDWNDIWIMPNPGDAGNALGSVLVDRSDFVEWPGAFLGYNIDRDYDVNQVVQELETVGIAGVANGRAEYGPRALGNRSLLADPRGSDVKDRVNDIKQRQKFRPFAPAILEEHAADHFSGTVGAYMQFTARCRYPKLYPAIVHKDGTSRVQTVSKQDNPKFRELLEAWYARTGCPMLLNTSLNIKGKPMVNTEQDAEQFEQEYGVRVF